MEPMYYAQISFVVGFVVGYISNIVKLNLTRFPTRRKINEISIQRRGEINENPKELDIAWKIENFFSPCRGYYSSDSFSFANESWYMVLCPEGKNQRSHHVSVYLVRESSGPLLKLKFCFSLKSLSKMYDLGTQCTLERAFEKDKMIGFDNFLSRSELVERSAVLVPSNTLTIVCTLKHPKSTEDTRNKSSHVLQRSKILQDFKQLYISQEDSDVIIKVKGQNFTAHKVILKARSPVFASTFRNDMKEKTTGIVHIEDCEPATFSEFLRFLYHGHVNDLSSENVVSLYTVADKYDVSDLKTECLQFMKKNLSVDTFFETMTLAQCHSETELVDLTNVFFVNNAQNIIETTKWELYLVENPTHSNKLFLEYMASKK